MKEVPELGLPGGVAIPVVGCGTWMLEGAACERAVSEALDLGYTHVDTASGYGNEEDVGRAIGGADRDRLFITSKVWREHLEPAALRRVCEQSLRDLGSEYLDLLLIHWPNSDIPIQRTIDGFRQLRDDGLIRAWGVSNFTAAHLREAAEVERPATNQVELHPYFNQRELRRVCRDLSVPITAYTPLAKGRVLEDAVLREIGETHGKSAAQVALRWSVQHGHVVIPKASGREHLQENLDVLDFELSGDDMARIDDRPQGERIVDGDWSEFDRGRGDAGPAEDDVHRLQGR